MIEGNQPCVCGHIKDFHKENVEFTNYDICKICFLAWKSKWILSPKMCAGFKLDNLTYLENLYDRKISTNSR